MHECNIVRNEELMPNKRVNRAVTVLLYGCNRGNILNVAARAGPKAA
jgi:hypothetical protein